MTEKGKILIVSNGPLCRNPRVFKEANTLGAAGYTVTVLTVRNHAPSEAHDLALLKDALFQRITVDMLPHFDTSPLKVLGRRITLWLARKIARAPFPFLRSIHSLGPAWSLLRSARRQPADLTIVHNEIAHWVGVQLMAEGRLVAADIEDWHSEDLLPQDRRYRPLAIIRQVESALLQRAVYTTTTSQALAMALHACFGGRQPEVITNSFPLQANFRQGADAALPSFIWFSQTIGPGRGLEQFMSAWCAMRQPSRLVLVGTSAGSFAEQLLNTASVELRSRIEILGLVATAELPSLIARHDIGLALEPSSSRNNDLTISNKILQYLNAGLAIVATPTTGQQEVMARTLDAGVLIDLGSPVATAQKLDEFVSDKPRLALARRNARTAAETSYCWEREAPRLLTIVAGALARPAR